MILRNRYTLLITCLCLCAAILTLPAITRAADCLKMDHAHSAWSALLQSGTSDDRVAYAGLKAEAQAPLEAYLESLSATCASEYVTWSRDQRLAFWINAYNAFTVKLIVDHHPISSIRKIGFLPGAAFRRRFIPMPGLKGADVSLDNIENDTLRADFSEPRIHFALVCASVGCPPLRKEAYRASELESQLDEQTRLFLKDAEKNRFDPETNTLYLSPIFKWFRADFEAVAGSLAAYVANYLDDPRIGKPGVKVAYTEYDWSLNGATPAD